MKKSVVTAVAIIAGLLPAITTIAQEKAKMTEVSPSLVAEIQKHVNSLLAMRGDHFLNIEARGRKDVVQLTKIEKDGKTTLTVLVVYPFKDAAEKTFTTAGIKVPSGWKNISFEEGFSVGFDVAGSDAVTIATFADFVFTRLMKSRPIDFLVDPDINQ